MTETLTDNGPSCAIAGLDPAIQLLASRIAFLMDARSSPGMTG
jgi:hypothetical protein